MEKVYIYDTTLRDGSQSEGVNFSLEDKLLITKHLDDFGIDYIEAGWPGSNPKDTFYFEKVKNMPLKHARIVAFGSTRKKGLTASSDPQVISLLKAQTPAVTIFGKSWDYHVLDAINTTLDENLSMIYDTVSFLKKEGREVIFDAEHFFDGFKSNKEYALKTVEVAFEAGADWVVLCDTNGGTLPFEMMEIFKEVFDRFKNANIGIHAHNDSECAVANSLIAVKMGSRQVHGTINGIGERTGNANLCSIIPALSLKMGFKTVEEESLRNLTELAKFVSEISNVPLPKNMPYVGSSAFAHKAGVHASAVSKKTDMYEHIRPELVGNTRKITISDMAGKSNVLYKLKEIGLSVDENSPDVIKLVEHIKNLEKEGYVFEAADASLELLLKRYFGIVKDFFELDFYKVEVLNRNSDELSEATVRIKIGDAFQHTAALGNGPVNALDRALRKALVDIYPSLESLELIDYKVRIVNETEGTSAKVRVLIESTDGMRTWGTVGVSYNVIDASWKALVDSISFKLLKDEEENL